MLPAMKLGRVSRRLIRYAVFAGVLAGTVFSGSGAFGIELETIAGRVASNDDIELEANATYTAGDPSGPGFQGSTYFGTYTGTLSGNGATITGLTVPLFITVSGEVKELNLATETVNGVVGNGALAINLDSDGIINSVIVTGNVDGSLFSYVGGLVGSSSGTIIDSTMNGNVKGNAFTGGLVGSSSGSISGSTVTGNSNISGGDNVGGLVGELSSGTISKATVAVTVTVTGSGEYIGGLAGSSYGSISESHSHAVVVGGTDNNPGDHGTGGLVGYLGGLLTDSSATGAVTGTNEVGGLVGSTGVAAEIRNSHATGDVNGDDKVGGLVGNLDLLHVIVDSYATGDVVGQDYVGGLVGYASGNISNSTVSGTVSISGHDNVGGLVGQSWGQVSGVDGVVTSVGNAVTVTGSGEYIGGLAGSSYGIISYSTAHAVVEGTGETDDDHGIGGLVGYLGGAVTDSSATGAVTGFNDVGGLVGATGLAAGIAYSHATGDVTGNNKVGGLVGNLDEYHVVTDSYATGAVIGNDDVGGLVGHLSYNASVTRSYAIGAVTGNLTEEGGDVGGLVGIAYGDISYSHATGDVSGVYDTGGLVGDLDEEGSIRNSYATGNVTATGFDGWWRSGWGGLVGEFEGIIENSYATGNVLADYHAGSLVGFTFYNSEATINNSFSTGSVSQGERNPNYFIFFDLYEFDSVDPDGWQDAFGGFVGCQESLTSNDAAGYSFSCSVDEPTQSTPVAPSILSVVNSVDVGEESAFEILACKNNGLPLLSDLSDSYANTCAAPVTTNRERRIREFIQTTSMTEIAKTLGFVVSPKFPNDAPIAFIKNEKELAISKILGVQKAADRVATTFVKTGEALQLSYEYEGKDPIELWVKLADGKWLLAGVATFDKGGKVVVLPMQFKIAGEYLLVLNKPSAESVKANTPLNQIGALTVIVS